MPGLYGETMENLERIKDTHPNLYNVWKVFLERRKERMFHILHKLKITHWFTVINHIHI